MQIINIAIVENEKECSRQLKEQLDQWQSGFGERCEIHVTEFATGEDIVADGGADFHIIFMDIGLDGKMNGVEAARLLREKHYRESLVFLTSYNEYACDGYSVSALDYILKPVTYDRIENCMNRVLRSLTSGYYLFCERGDTVKLPYSKILYCLSSLHYVDIVTEDGTFRKKGSLKKLKLELSMQFEQCHRTVIVNIDHVVRLSGKNVVMSDGAMFPVSEPYLEKIRNAYIEHII